MSRRWRWRIFITLSIALSATPLWATGGCTRLTAGVTLLLRDGTHTFKGTSEVTCFAANGEENYEGSFAGSLTVHQVDPSVDFTTTIQGMGYSQDSVEGPAEYTVKTCYQASVSATSGTTSGAGQSSEQCTPDSNPTDRCNSGDMVLLVEGDCSGATPVVLNLGRNYQLSGADDPVIFDIFASGGPVRIGWTAAGASEAFLCLDRNGDGKITSGAELFGGSTLLKNGRKAPNGFVALAEFDDNHDGLIDSRDAIWPSLIAWTDLNHDGASQPSEMVPLSASGVNAIGLDYHWTGRRDASGNVFRYESTVWVVKAAGAASPKPVYDIVFAPVP
jgi:hypothetical protein